MKDCWEGESDMGRGAFAIETRGLEKQFGFFPVLRGINLAVGQGEFLTIFGPNGAGKSTLLSILATFIKPGGGEVFVSGFDVSKEKQRIRKLIGFISHNTMLYENLTAWENLEFIGAFYDVPDFKNRCSDILERVELYGKKDALVSTLSFGTRQRLAIARTLLHDPQILFLDEPYSGLDYGGAAILTSILGSMKADKTVVMTTHNVYEGLSLCDNVAILDQGEVVYASAQKPAREEFQDIYMSCVRSGDGQ
ncbi:MAG: ABC transporter ATP-binding protein [Candidatus Dadabacteria bacterium]|nr:ABC transporter ATP-binding protein [Candidatus Dadabacteria bacterium]MDE0476616.1 ABC transporter ATP-binding protein [Candidatus Dadabacteria bacterium]